MKVFRLTFFSIKYNPIIHSSYNKRLEPNIYPSLFVILYLS